MLQGHILVWRCCRTCDADCLYAAFMCIYVIDVSVDGMDESKIKKKNTKCRLILHLLSHEFVLLLLFYVIVCRM